MAFCSNCGDKLIDGAKFCEVCGAPINTNMTRNENKRQQEFAGKIIKCPNCGETLSSFMTNCPSCRFEVRGVKATSSVREFSLKLEAIEAKREYEKPRRISTSNTSLERISKTDEQKISLIQSFSVPNTKEDIMEFMILATSNVNLKSYDSTNRNITKSEKAINDAWNSKIQQVYEKAKRSYGIDSDFNQISELYDNCNSKIRKAKKKNIIKWILLVGWIPLLWIIIIAALMISNPKEEKKEISRLDGIENEVQAALNKGEYKLALSIADSIDYQRYDIEQERKWDIQREYWVNKVLEEALKQGVELEYTPSEDIDKANESTSSGRGDNSRFVGGFTNGVSAGVDTAKQNIDEFNRIMNGVDN